MTITQERQYLRTDATWEEFIIELGEKLMEGFCLLEQDWTIKFIDEDPKLDSGSAGFCYLRGRVIVLSREFLLDTDERNIEETLLHEITHALLNHGDHTREFFDKLKEIGGSGLWYGSDGVTTTNYPVKYNEG